MQRKIILPFSFIIAIMLFTSNVVKSSETETPIASSSGEDLKILTWNIYMLPHCSFLHGNCKRARFIAENLHESNYDIIVFQEAFDYRARQILRRGLREKYPYMYGPANESLFSLRTSSGLWIISRIPLNKIKEIEYRTRCGIDAMARKGAVLFSGTWRGHEFQLAGTHLQSDSPDEVRRGQCRQISDQLLKAFAKSDVPQIVCGDFNIDMDDAANYTYMIQTLDAQNGQIEGEIHTSFDEIDNQLAKKVNGKKSMIDYVLVRNTKFIQSVKRRISVLRENKNNQNLDLSDHYGVEALVNFASVKGYSHVALNMSGQP
jgi:endonuclease/exonuclease/phosphatase family metal-dependent hydrolase